MELLLSKIKKYIPKKLFKKLQPAYHFVLSWLSAVWYRFPSNKLIVIGVTGTTGKTTSIYLMAKMLNNAGYKIGFTSTAIFNDGEKEWLNDKKMTMAGRFFTQKIIARMVKNKCHYAIIETTSQGIIQYRHRFINYDILVFTGLYPEHIESHGSFENYKKAKGKLFSHLKNCRTKYSDDLKSVVKADKGMKKIELNRIKKTIIVNLNDEQADYFLNFWAEEKWSYTNNNELRINLTDKNLKVVYYSDIKADKNGVSFNVQEKKRIDLKLLGEFNAINALTAVCLGLNQGLTLEQIKDGLEKIFNVPGRLEIIDQGQPFTVIVDYAFEPNALAKLYETIKKLEHKKIIHVLGSAGGGRDTGRRPVLGKLAGEKADIVIITNEDPYNDNPEMIIDQVLVGAESAGKARGKDLYKILDRREAINKALAQAGEGDLILITGKGCEQAICLADGAKLPWDDRRVVKEELKKLK